MRFLMFAITLVYSFVWNQSRAITKKCIWYDLVSNIPHCVSLLILMKLQLLKEYIYGNKNEDLGYDNDKDL